MTKGPPLLTPEHNVLSTLRDDGSRRWLKPKLSKGKLWRWRRLVAYVLLALYTLLPFIEVGDAPAILLDIPARRFTLFGYTFLPTDTAMLALSAVGTVLAIFLVTALLGRVWCGWACPQTVYMEFVFRPIERWLDGTVGRGGRPRRAPPAVKLALRYVVYGLVSFVLANTFLAYFVGVRELGRWMLQSPLSHPVPFLVMAGLTALMLVHFSYFREQLCILVCPYGRLQSVLLDKNSLIVSYDSKRGEPRGKASKVATKAAGDCVDCGLCVKTCPTGIDIREGLQMECLHCTQCIDACNPVMAKLGRAPDLIRYSSQDADAGRPKKLLRARVVIYPLIIAAVIGALVVVAAGKRSFDAVLLRNTGQPFTLTESGEVRNVLRLKTTSRSDAPVTLEITVVQPEGVTLAAGTPTIELAPQAVQTLPLSALADPSLFPTGQLPLILQVRSDGGEIRTVEATMLGPQPRPQETP